MSRFLHRFRRSDEELLDEEIKTWAESVPGVRRIEGCPSREPVRVAGQVSRLTLRPMNGSVTLEAVVSDGTGEVTAAWLGRSHIPGLSLGTPVVLEGVIAVDSASYRMVNPRFEFAS
ncbi:MAG: DNA-binding protein [Actinomycetota bacterium]